MKNLKFFFVSALCAFAITSCRKPIIAMITFNKTEYHGGDTIFMKNVSTNAYSYLWTMPDGTTRTTRDAYWATDSSFAGGRLRFYMEALSKNGKQTALVAGLADVWQPKNVTDIWQSNFSFNYHPNRKKSYIENGNWVVDCIRTDSVSYPIHYKVYFGGGKPVSNGTFTMQSALAGLQAGQVYVKIKPDFQEFPFGFYSRSGTLNLTINSTGQCHINFNNISGDQLDFGNAIPEICSCTLTIY